jgi:hypothetical protein
MRKNDMLAGKKSTKKSTMPIPKRTRRTDENKPICTFRTEIEEDNKELKANMEKLNAIPDSLLQCINVSRENINANVVHISKKQGPTKEFKYEFYNTENLLKEELQELRVWLNNRNNTVYKDFHNTLEKKGFFQSCQNLIIEGRIDAEAELKKIRTRKLTNLIMINIEDKKEKQSVVESQVKILSTTKKRSFLQTQERNEIPNLLNEFTKKKKPSEDILAKKDELFNFVNKVKTKEDFYKDIEEINRKKEEEKKAIEELKRERDQNKEYRQLYENSQREKDLLKQQMIENNNKHEEQLTKYKQTVEDYVQRFTKESQSQRQYRISQVAAEFSATCLQSQLPLSQDSRKNDQETKNDNNLESNEIVTGEMSGNSKKEEKIEDVKSEEDRRLVNNSNTSDNRDINKAGESKSKDQLNRAESKHYKFNATVAVKNAEVLVITDNNVVKEENPLAAQAKEETSKVEEKIEDNKDVKTNPFLKHANQISNNLIIKQTQTPGSKQTDLFANNPLLFPNPPPLSNPFMSFAKTPTPFGQGTSAFNNIASKRINPPINNNNSNLLSSLITRSTEVINPINSPNFVSNNPTYNPLSGNINNKNMNSGGQNNNLLNNFNVIQNNPSLQNNLSNVNSVPFTSPPQNNLHSVTNSPFPWNTNNQNYSTPIINNNQINNPNDQHQFKINNGNQNINPINTTNVFMPQQQNNSQPTSLLEESNPNRRKLVKAKRS